jgi:nuclear pore complex protein Nup188
MDGAAGGSYRDVSFGHRGGSQTKTLRIEDIGMELDVEGEDGFETVIADALDLVRSVIQDNPTQAGILMQSLEDGELVVSHSMTELQPPDLVQLTTMILEESLSRVKSVSPTRLIASALSRLFLPSQIIPIACGFIFDPP